VRPATLLAAVVMAMAGAAAPEACPVRAAGPETPAAPVAPPIETNLAPPADALYRPPVDVDADPPAFYARTHYRERGLARDAGGFDADARAWVVPFRQYVDSKPLRPTRGRHTIVLVPLGPQDEQSGQRIGRVRDFLAAYLTLPVETWPPAPLAGRPSRQATVAGRTVRQNDAEDILDTMLEPQRAGNLLALVGLSTQDLYSEREDWPSVGHVSRTGRGLAVVGLARTFPEFFGKESRPDRLYRDLRLTFGMAADAACRSLGLTPCRKYYCVMNQARRSSTVEPLHLCPDCLRKLRWTLGFDPAERYEALARFYRKSGLPVEATWVRRRMAECRKALAEAKADDERNTE